MLPNVTTGSMIGAAALLLAVSAAHAIDVNCDEGGSVGKAIAAAKPGDTIVVQGICRENVLISAGAVDIAIEGQGGASIIGTNPKAAVILILGREITVRGLRLTEGRNGINVLRGASAVVDGVTIENTGRSRIPGSGLGINIGQHAFAAVVGSTIRNNWRAGILIHENSSARIGFVDIASISGGNTIGENGVGIDVIGGSQVRVAATNVVRNRGDGIRVQEGSHLEFADNRIEGNGGNGVTVTRNSGAVIEVGGTITEANRTAPDAQNGGYGIVCRLGGYVEGLLGTLSGMRGKTSIGEGCSGGGGL